MGDYTPKLAKVARDVLEPGETLLAGVRAMAKGATRAMVSGAGGAVVGGAAGMVVAEKVASSADDEPASTPPVEVGTAPQVALGLTDRRFLVWRRSSVTGRAKDLIGALPLDRIRFIQGAASRAKVTPDRITLHLTDGSELSYEVVKLDGYERLVDAFDRLRPSPSTDPKEQAR